MVTIVECKLNIQFIASITVELEAIRERNLQFLLETALLQLQFCFMVVVITEAITISFMAK